MVNGYYLSYQLAMILSLLSSLLVIALVGKRRQANGAKAMISLAAGILIWVFGFLLEANSGTLERQLFFNNVGYIGAMTVPVAWFVFAMSYTLPSQLVSRKTTLFLSIIPAVTVILIWTNSLHHLMWSGEHLVSSGPFIVTAKTYGPFFWIALVYNYILIVTGSATLIKRLFIGTRLYASQAISLLVAASVPLIWNIIYVFNLIPLPRKDLTPVMFAVSSIAVVLGLLRFRLFAVAPFAHDFIIRQVRHCVLIFNAEDELVEVNPAGMNVLGLDKHMVGMSVKSLPLPSDVSKYLKSSEPISTEVVVSVPGKERYFTLDKTTLRDNQKNNVGWLAILRDITENKKLQERLVFQERLASIGRFAAGVAHEINNPLAIIAGYSELLATRGLADDINADLEIINSEAFRAAGIVKEIVTFVHGQPEFKKPIEINRLIQNALKLSNCNKNPNDIKIVTHFVPDLAKVMGNRLQLRQVFLNIIVNDDNSLQRLSQTIYERLNKSDHNTTIP